MANRWYWIAAVLFVLFVMYSAFLSVSTPIEAPRRSTCRNNLKQIGLALHNYHETYGCLPPAYIADANGRPMHSWRVLLLPYLDQTPLYQSYRFDEPWDGPNNSKLAKIALPIFCCPSDEHNSGTNAARCNANYLAVVGDETAWPGPRPTTIGEMKDGTSETLLLIEVTNSGIHWMEPRDLHVLQMAPSINAKAGQGISSRHKSGANSLMADGAVRFLPDSLPAETLRGLLTIDGGEKPGPY
ncbi:MAG: DUF1559 domain-containing protein [Planctomycetia bacterium]|nr:DUF1559 domain-containing protein [Planctomycetia bacterium]